MTMQRPSPIRGVYENQFWDHVQKRELRLQRCDKGHFRFPAGPCCPRCLSAEFTWEKVSGKGKVVSWTTFHRQYFKQMPIPYTVVSAEIEEGALIIADLVGAHDQPLRVGAPVELVFEDGATKEGDLVLYRWKVEP